MSNKEVLVTIPKNESEEIEHIAETIKSLKYLSITLNENIEYKNEKKLLYAEIRDKHSEYIQLKKKWWKKATEKYNLQKSDDELIMVSYIDDEIYKIKKCTSCECNDQLM